MAYKSQGRSLIDVQIRGKEFEKEIKKLISGDSGPLLYIDTPKKSTIQADLVIPSLSDPNIVLSITHTKPDTKGHSNENKFQLKLGELAFWKTFNPNLKVIIVISGKQEEWLNYVLEAFPIFFDDYIYTWENNALNKLNYLSDISLKNELFWKKEKERRDKIKLSSEMPPNSRLREQIYNHIVKKYMGIDDPAKIENEVFRRCMEASFKKYLETNGKSGKEWAYLKMGTSENYEQFWELRSFFNPSESAVMLTLEKMKIPFLGSIAGDVTLPSMLSKLGMPEMRTKVAEDFVLWSEKYNMPVFIQCKSSGGGKERHGKNIQNRAKEQYGRSILYRCSVEKISKKYELTSSEKWFKWISILDGNWGVNKEYQLKYIHMLQIAGYDKIISADKLINDEYDIKYPNLLSIYLDELECNIQKKYFDEQMRRLNISEKTSYRFQQKLLNT